MANEVMQSLFGLDSTSAAEALRQRRASEDLAFAQLTPQQQIVYMGAQAGRQAGAGLNQLFGYTSPELQRVRAREQALQDVMNSGISLDDPIATTQKLVEALYKRGDEQGAAMVMMKFQEDYPKLLKAQQQKQTASGVTERDRALLNTVEDKIAAGTASAAEKRAASHILLKFVQDQHRTATDAYGNEQPYTIKGQLEYLSLYPGIAAALGMSKPAVAKQQQEAPVVAQEAQEAPEVPAVPLPKEEVVIPEVPEEPAPILTPVPAAAPAPVAVPLPAPMPAAAVPAAPVGVPAPLRQAELAPPVTSRAAPVAAPAAPVSAAARTAPVPKGTPVTVPVGSPVVPKVGMPPAILKPPTKPVPPVGKDITQKSVKEYEMKLARYGLEWQEYNAQRKDITDAEKQAGLERHQQAMEADAALRTKLAAQAEAREQAKFANEQQEKQKANINNYRIVRRGAKTTLELTKQAKNLIEKSPRTTTGWGAALSISPKSDARALANIIKGVQANVSLKAMLELKAASPTGSTGFGAMNLAELETLVNSLGTLDRFDKPEQLIDTLYRIAKYSHEAHGYATADLAESEKKSKGKK